MTQQELLKKISDLESLAKSRAVRLISAERIEENEKIGIFGTRI